MKHSEDDAVHKKPHEMKTRSGESADNFGIG